MYAECLLWEGGEKTFLPLFVFVTGEPEHDWTADETDGSQSAIPLHADITGKGFHAFIPFSFSNYRLCICNRVTDKGTFGTVR